MAGLEFTLHYGQQKYSYTIDAKRVTNVEIKNDCELLPSHFWCLTVLTRSNYAINFVEVARLFVMVSIREFLRYESTDFEVILMSRLAE